MLMAIRFGSAPRPTLWKPTRSITSAALARLNSGLPWAMARNSRNIAEAAAMSAAAGSAFASAMAASTCSSPGPSGGRPTFQLLAAPVKSMWLNQSPAL